MSVLSILSASPGNQFPPNEIHRFLRQGRYGRRIGSGAPYYAGAVLEFVSAEILHRALNAAQRTKATRISVSHVQTAVGGGGELNKLLAGVTINPRQRDEWSSYIYNVLKKVHRNVGIESKAMKTMNAFIQEVFEKLATEASREMNANRRSALSSKELRKAVGLLLPGNVGKRADVLASARAAKYAPKL